MAMHQNWKGGVCSIRPHKEFTITCYYPWQVEEFFCRACEELGLKRAHIIWFLFLDYKLDNSKEISEMFEHPKARELIIITCESLDRAINNKIDRMKRGVCSMPKEWLN